MTTIKVLDENTANKIAAGEVVDRPASIIKELIENAIDAKSSKIEIEISEGGIAFIRVTDNGTGMSHDDAQLAILRHATSKISAADDLSRIRTLGFRGEALPTIAAVSKFSLTTRLHDRDFATLVEVQGGVLTDVRESGGNVGTTIVVQDLFYNTPARHKFLKKPAAEGSHIHQTVIKLALSHPDIAFKLINNNRLVLATPGNHKLHDTLTSLYGNAISSELLPVSFTADDMAISGFLSKPTLLKSSRQWQTYLMNARVINSRIIAKALDNAYHSLLPKSGYPLAVLNITVPVDSLDVNVHPQKSEVKFADDSKMFKTIYHAITETLRAQQSPSQIAASASLAGPSFSSYQPQLPAAEIAATRYTPAAISQLELLEPQEPAVSLGDAQTLIARESPLAVFEHAAPGNTQISLPPPGRNDFDLYPLGQIADCYIIAYNHDGMFIVDQHAAHERILYDRLGKSAERIPAQQLLVPPFIEFDETDCNLITENQQLFFELGFSLELIGPNTMRLLEIPADIPLSEAEQIVRQILQAIQELHQPSAQELRHACLQITACRAAIKAGDSLNMRQIQALLNELCQTTLPYTCPHGRPAIIRFTPQDLAKMFKRT